MGKVWLHYPLVGTEYGGKLHRMPGIPDGQLQMFKKRVQQNHFSLLAQGQEVLLNGIENRIGFLGESSTQDTFQTHKPFLENSLGGSYIKHECPGMCGVCMYSTMFWVSYYLVAN